MAKPLKVKTFSISTPEDIPTLEEFLSTVKEIESILHISDSKVMVVYEEE